MCKSKRGLTYAEVSITQCGLACPVCVQWFRVSSHPVWAHVFRTIPDPLGLVTLARRPIADDSSLGPQAGAQAAIGLFWVLISLNVASKHLFHRHRASQTTGLCAEQVASTAATVSSKGGPLFKGLHSHYPKMAVKVSPLLFPLQNPTEHLK